MPDDNMNDNDSDIYDRRESGVPLPVTILALLFAFASTGAAIYFAQQTKEQTASAPCQIQNDTLKKQAEAQLDDAKIVRELRLKIISKCVDLGGTPAINGPTITCQPMFPKNK